MPVDQQFNSINEKLQQLLKQHIHLQKENERLREELKRIREGEISTEQKIETLQQQVSILKISAGTPDEKDKKAFEKKINQYVREIDRCISELMK